jgi:hypothetical protein
MRSTEAIAESPILVHAWEVVEPSQEEVEDRQRLEQVPAVRETLDHLDGMMSIIVHLYHQVAAYPSPEEQQ